MNNDLISREALKKHKFAGDRYIQIGGRTNGKILGIVNRAYRQGWNDAIYAIIKKAPTVKPCENCDLYFKAMTKEEMKKGDAEA